MATGAITLLDLYEVASAVDDGFRCIHITGTYFAVAYLRSGYIRIETYTCSSDGNGTIVQIATKDFTRPYGDSTHRVEGIFKVADGYYGVASQCEDTVNASGIRSLIISTFTISDTGAIGASFISNRHIRTSGFGSTWWTRPYKNILQVGSSRFFAIPHMYMYLDGSWVYSPRLAVMEISTVGVTSATAADEEFISGKGDADYYGNIALVSGDIYVMASGRDLATFNISSSTGAITAVDTVEDITPVLYTYTFITRAIGNYFALVAGSTPDGYIYSVEIATDGTLPAAATSSAIWESTHGGFNWVIRSCPFSDEAWLVVSGAASDWDGQLRAFTISSSGVVAALSNQVEYTARTLDNSTIIRFDDDPSAPYYVVSSRDQTADIGVLYSFTIDERLCVGGGFIWVEGTQFHYIDQACTDRYKEGTATGSTGTAGYGFVEGTYFHYIDESGDERRFEGSTSAVSGKLAGQVSIHGRVFAYIDNTGAERETTGTVA